jgi:hypothetical protein
VKESSGVARMMPDKVVDWSYRLGEVIRGSELECPRGVVGISLRDPAGEACGTCWSLEKHSIGVMGRLELGNTMTTAVMGKIEAVLRKFLFSAYCL